VDVIRGGSFEVTVPQGWTASTVTGTFVRLDHSTGASLLIIRTRSNENLDSFARRGAERIMAPLGFAKIEDPRHFSDSDKELVQYEIWGNRLSERRRILYRALRSKDGLFEVVYENNENRFDLLLTEAQAIAASLQSVPPPPPTGRGRRASGAPGEGRR
jgi:hypothetical protein